MLPQELLHTRAADIDDDRPIADIVDANADAFDPLDLHELLFMDLLHRVYVSHRVRSVRWPALTGAGSLCRNMVHPQAVG